MINVAANESEVKVDVSLICVGMYVTSLDVPWNMTRFIFEGVLVRTQSDIDELFKYCKWVLVSPVKSTSGIFNISKKVLPILDSVQARTVVRRETGVNWLLNFIQNTLSAIASKPLKLFSLINGSSLKENYNIASLNNNTEFIDAAIKEDFKKIVKAKAIRTQFNDDSSPSVSIVNHLVTQSVGSEAKKAQFAQKFLVNATSMALSSDLSSSKLHESIDIARDALSDVVDSVARNPDAMQLMTKIKSLDNDSYQHAIEVSLLMVALGRELCFSKSDLIEIGLGGLLHDVGEIKLPDSNYSKRIKNITKFKVYRDIHVEEGIAVAKLSNHSAIVKQIIENHHEHYDGSGYPKGRSKGQIGVYGNMAAIVDSYVSLTNGRCCDSPLPPNKALSVMYKQKGKMFHPELLDQFIQIIGLYPVGSMVQLSSGNIGIVIKQNKAWRLKPVVMVVMNKRREKLPNPISIDLMGIELTKKPIFILAEIPTDAIDIRVEDYF